MIIIGSPTSCFGETLKAGTIRLAEFCLIKSSVLLVIFLVDIFTVTQSIRIPRGYIVFPALLVVLSIIKIVCNVLLYHGARKGVPSYMKPWFWVYSIQTVLLFFGGIGGALTMDFILPLAFAPAGLFFMFVLVYCTASKYFCHVVYNLIQEMERGHVYDDSIRPVAFTNENA